jgi:adenosine kinase
MPILISGSLVHDFIMNFPDEFKNYIKPEKTHVINVCFTVENPRKSWGGTAGNIAFTLKMLGIEPLIVSALGKDGDGYAAYLRGQKIGLEHVVTDDKTPTASAYITTDADDNQIIALHEGPLSMAEKISIRNIKEPLSLAIISAAGKKVMEKHLKEAWELGIKTVFDPSRQADVFSQIELQKMISQSHFIIGNDYEMEMLRAKTEWSDEEILKNAKVLITTLGDKGSVIKTAEGEVVEVGPCPPQSFDDPTGAGDAYRAGFFAGYELGYNWKTCGQMGSVAASYAIETPGTQEYKFTKEEFCERYRKNYNETINLTAL